MISVLHKVKTLQPWAFAPPEPFNPQNLYFLIFIFPPQNAQPRQNTLPPQNAPPPQYAQPRPRRIDNRNSVA